MTDHDALLQAVIAAPDDDLPRLVFADFLEESGHPANVARATFIRLQIEAEREANPRQSELLIQANDLRPLFRDEWDQFLAHQVHRADTTQSRTHHHHVRGFVHTLRLHCQILLDYPKELFAAGPLRDLQVETSPYPVDSRLRPKLESIAGLSQLLTLRLKPMAGVAELPAENRNPSKYRIEINDLIQTNYLSSLKTLICQANNVSDDWIIDFVRSFPMCSFYRSLEHLDFSNNRITDMGAVALIGSRWFDRLTLDLRNNPITSTGIDLLRQRFGSRLII